MVRLPTTDTIGFPGRRVLDRLFAHGQRTTRPLLGRHILVTGASSGIGRATALALADEGATVLLLARRADELDIVAAQIRATGGRAHPYPCDITDPRSVAQTVETILTGHDHVDMLVNNAGRSIRRSLYHSTDRLHDFERTMAVNYFGAVSLTLALLPHMRARGSGHIVNISTASVPARTPRFAAYVASKAALEGFADVAAGETLADGITFTTVRMPLVRTPMIAPTEEYTDARVATPEQAAALIVRALVDRPRLIDVPIGTLAEFGNLLIPRIADRMRSRLYRASGDSTAARGSDPTADGARNTPAPPRRATGPTVLPAPEPLRRLTRWIPGVHW